MVYLKGVLKQKQYQKLFALRYLHCHKIDQLLPAKCESLIPIFFIQGYCGFSGNSQNWLLLWIKPTGNLQESCLEWQANSFQELESLQQGDLISECLKVKICCLVTQLKHKCSIIPEPVIAVLSRQCQFCPSSRRCS